MVIIKENSTPLEITRIKKGKNYILWNFNVVYEIFKNNKNLKKLNSTKVIALSNFPNRIFVLCVLEIK